MRSVIVEKRRFVAKLHGRRSRAGLLAIPALIALTATPAAANPLSDCFQRIAVAFHPHHHPHRAAAHTAIHRVHHVGPRLHPRQHRIAASGPTRTYAHRTRYILRPIACAAHPAVALMTPVPGAVAPETPQQLLAELAGPAAATAPAVAVDTAAVAPAPVEALPEVPEVGAPFFGFPGVFSPGGGVFIPGGPGLPGGPGGVFPATPPVVVGPPVIGVPPDVVPPVTPPEGPGGGQPPPIPPDVTGVPVTVTPVIPVTPPPGGPVGGVPEPASWALLLVGFFGLGGALRRGRALRA